MPRQLDLTPNKDGRVVVGVLSDTHGVLSPTAFRALSDLDPQLIVHAGDICGYDILPRLEMLAPTVAVLGNNDYCGQYGSGVTGRAEFEVLGVDFVVTHIPSRLYAPLPRIAVCGHTHVPSVQQCGASTIVNPGSTTRPRSDDGPTIASIVLEPGYVRAIRIIKLNELDS